MIELHQLPKFRGEATDDAEDWLTTFVAATGNLSDGGVLRILSRQLPFKSPAREWYDGLDDTLKNSWGAFEPQFCARWINQVDEVPSSSYQERTFAEAHWDKLQRHYFNDKIYKVGPEKPLDDLMSIWMTEHQQLATNAKRFDRELVIATLKLIPAFLRAQLRVIYPDKEYSFQEMCNALQQVPAAVWQLEQLRRKEAAEEWHARMEGKLEEISKKLDQLVEKLDGNEAGNPLTVATEVITSPYRDSSGENLQWEACSSLTSAASDSHVSEPTTPTTHLNRLPGSGGNDHFATSVSPGSGADTVFPITEPLSSIWQGEQTPHTAGSFVPAGWRKPQVTLTRIAIASTAQRAIDIMFQFPENTSVPGLTGSTCCLWPIYDRLMGTNGYSIEGQLSKIYASCGNINDYGPSNLWSGLASIQLYRSYDKIEASFAAQRVWANITESTYCGVFDSKRVSVKYVASGVPTFAGGVIGYDGEHPYYHIQATKTILYMVLSAYLAEQTGQEMYQKAAEETADYVKSRMFDPVTSLIDDSVIRLDNCEKILIRRSSHLTGLFIEGLCVLASVTGDESWMSMALGCSVAAVRFAEWHSHDGIFSVGTDHDPSKVDAVKAFKGLLIRGLHEAYQRNPLNVSFRNLVRSYVNVQCNALLDLSRCRNSYGINWSGPYIGPFLHGQAAAVDVFVAAIGVNGL